jgi:hypothetical protein
MLGARTGKVLVALSCAIMQFVAPGYATETRSDRLVPFVGKSPARAAGAPMSLSEAGRPLHEEQPSAEPFGLPTEKVLDGLILSVWLELEERLREESDILVNCDKDMSSCPEAAKLFLALISKASADGGLPRIGILNRAINTAIRPTSDLAQWGVPDRWSTPLETLYIATRRLFADDHQAEVAFEVSHREVSAIPSYRSVSTLDAPRNTHVQLSR